MAIINATTKFLKITSYDVDVSRTGIVWPSTLPEYFFAHRYTETPRSQSIRSEVDVGLAQVRRRYTKEIYDINGSMRMSQDQLTIFDEWFDDILLGGTQTFIMTNALSLEDRTMRFMKPPSYSHEGGVYYQVSLSLEVLP